MGVEEEDGAVAGSPDEDRDSRLLSEFRNRLTVVLTNGALALEMIDGPARERIARAVAAAKRLDPLADRLVQVGRLPKY